MSTDPQSSIRARNKVGVILALALGAIGAAWVSSLGETQDAGTGLAAVLVTWAKAGLGPALYIVAGAGFGRPLAGLFRESPAKAALQMASGLSLLLLITHVLGVAGVLSSRVAGVPVALMVDIVGIGLLFAQMVGAARRGDFAIGAPDWAWLLALPAIVVLVVASCIAPGWLWDSEFGAFDALSYHLQLPQEWMASGRVWPTTHNVYSYLPSLMEGAFVHVHASIPNASAGETRELGLLSGDGYGAISPQILHALFTLSTAYVIASLGRTLAIGAGASATHARRAGTLAGAIFLATPWTLVVGSLAYNEMGLMLGLSGAMLACVSPGLRPAGRGLLAGLLVGAACGSKPTAILFAGAPVAILLLSMIPRRQWAMAIGAGCIAGLLALSPWVIRNQIACGNPVFPFAADIFGGAHWTAEQLARFKGGHTFNGTTMDRLRLLVLPDPTDPAGLRHRGLMHPQFSWLPPLTVLVGVFGVISPRTRRMSLLLLAGMVTQLFGWLFFTHLQSRFLIPLMAPACALLALGAVSLLATQADMGAGKNSPMTPPPPKFGTPAWAAQTMRWIPAMLVGVATIAFGADSVFQYSRQRRAHPNSTLLFGPHEFTGRNLAPRLAQMPEAEREKLVRQGSPEIFVNMQADQLFPRATPSGPRSGLLYLLGDSTPFYFQVPLLQHTTWDASPLGAAIAAHPDDPAAWTRALRDQGVTYVLVNFSELTRLNQSGPGKTSWYDPRVTPEVVANWARTLGTPVAAWNEAGRFLFRIPASNHLASAAAARPPVAATPGEGAGR